MNKLVLIEKPNQHISINEIEEPSEENLMKRLRYIFDNLSPQARAYLLCVAEDKAKEFNSRQ